MPRAMQLGAVMRWLVLAVMLVGCGSPRWSFQRLTRDPVHGDLVSVSCEGSQNLCYSVAARACPQGFAIADSGGQNSQRLVPVYNAVTGQTTYYTRNGYAGSMLVRCAPDGQGQSAQVSASSDEVRPVAQPERFPGARQ